MAQMYVFMHFIVCVPAGYNNVEVAEFLLENGADVNAQDKGGLIPLHNASSYGVSVSLCIHFNDLFLLAVYA